MPPPTISAAHDKQQCLLRGAVVGAAWLTMALGVVLAAAWLGAGAWAKPMAPGLSYAALSSSLAFIGAGFGLLADLQEARRSVLCAGGLVLLIAGVTLLEHLAGAGNVVAPLLPQGIPSPAIPDPAWMAPLSSVALACVGTQFLLAGRDNRQPPGYSIAAEVPAIISIALGAASVSGHMPGDASADGWGRHAGMTLQGAGFLCLGAGLLALAWHRQCARIALMRQKTGQRLQRSENKLNAVVEHAVDGLISIDENGVIEHFNPAAERIFGYRRAEVVGHGIETLMTEPHGSGQAGDLLRYFAGCHPDPGGIGRCDVRAKRKDGSVFPMELALSGFQAKNGGHLPGILRDVSVRKQAEERKALLAAIVASSDDAIISETLEGIVTSWNRGAERLLGYSAEETIGQPASLIVPREGLEEEKRTREELSRSNDIQHFNTVRLSKSGRRIDVSLTISRLGTTGRIIGASTIIRDITAQKETEATLLRSTRALEHSNKELDDFAYIASHDLKEPLRGLISNATFLHEDYKDKLDDNGLKRLNRLRYLSTRMEKLVSDLLYFSRLGRQDMAIQSTNLNAAIHDIASMMETTLLEKNASIVIPRPLPEVVCDRTGVTEVFRNLITNAVKYNDKDVKTIEVGCVDKMKTKTGVERQVFYVRDNGIGIDEAFYEDIFCIFKRLNAEDDERKGSGVGLTFVRKIIDRHGGRVWLESTPGQGSTFYFTLTPNIAADVAA